MKKSLTTFIFVLFVTVLKGQTSVFMESGVSSLGSNNHIGIEHMTKSKVGFYVTFGGNWMDRAIGSNTSLVLDSKGDFQSTVSWYNKDGSYYQTLPPDPIFTSPEWGNKLLETGNCVNTVEMWNGELTTVTKNYNLGLVLPSKNNKNVKYRIGLGVRELSQKGYCDYEYWQHSFKVNKYYDEWGVIAQPSGVFVVVHSGSVREWGETKYTDISKTEFNINMAVEYEMINGSLISLGYNTKGGINVGFGFTIQ